MITGGIRKILSPSGRGSVAVISLLLLSSATLRILTSGTEAFAQGDQLPTTSLTAPTSRQVRLSDKEQSGEGTPSVSSLSSRGELSALIAALTEREAQVSSREQKLEMRLQALAIADAEITKRLENLAGMEDRLRKTLSLADEASEKDILKLTSVYESMKPKDAAVLFEEMEPNFAAGFLGRMRPEIAGSIMANLTPQAAYSISVILAGRNANVPKT